MDGTAEEFLAEWRRQHRSGNPSRLTADAELRAYVDRYITKMTFQDLAAKTREQFGADRAVSKSALSRYWLKHKDRLLAPPVEVG